MNRILLLLSILAPAMAAAAGNITVTDGWARAMPPGAPNSAGYLSIANGGDTADALVGATVEGVKVVEVHEMVRQGDAMTMRRVKELPVPAHGSATLAPGGLHLMLIGLEHPLKPGDRLKAVLHFRSAGEVTTELDVRAP